MAPAKRVKPRSYADLARRRRVVVGGGGVAWARPDAGDFLVADVAAASGTEGGLTLTAFALTLAACGLAASAIAVPRDLDVAGFAAFGASDAFVAGLGAGVFVTLERAPDSGSDLREFFGAFAGLAGRAFSGATLTLAEVGNVSATERGVSAACRVVFAFTGFVDFVDFTGVLRGADVRRVSGFLDGATARLGDAAAGVESSTRLDRLRVFTVAAGKSHNDTCATFVVFAFVFALCGVDGTSLVAFAFAFALAGCPVGFSALVCTVFFAATGRGTKASGALAALPVVFCLDGFSFAVILAEGFMARTFGLRTFASATGAGGAGSFGALPARAPVDAGADTATSCVGGVTLALDVRLLRGLGVWPSEFASTLATAGATDFAAGTR